MFRRAEQIIAEHGWWNGRDLLSGEKCLAMSVAAARGQLDRYGAGIAPYEGILRRITGTARLAKWNDSHTEQEVRSVLLQAAEIADLEDEEAANREVEAELAYLKEDPAPRQGDTHLSVRLSGTGSCALREGRRSAELQVSSALQWDEARQAQASPSQAHCSAA